MPFTCLFFFSAMIYLSPNLACACVGTIFYKLTSIGINIKYYGESLALRIFVRYREFMFQFYLQHKETIPAIFISRGSVRIFATQTWANLVLKFRFQVLDRAKAIIFRIQLSSIELTLSSSLLLRWTFDFTNGILRLDQKSF